MKPKILNIIYYFILTSYVALLTANITHYHSVHFNTNLSPIFSENNLLNRNPNHSYFDCPLHITINNLHNVNLTVQSHQYFLFNESEKLVSLNKHSTPLLNVYHSILLRAPPELLL